MGWEVRSGRESKAPRSSIHWSSHCVLMEVQKRAWCTCQTEKVVRSSFTPIVALLVHPSGTVHPTVDHHGFTRSQRPGAFIRTMTDFKLHTVGLIRSYKD